jgi:TolB-like protein/DNA-binding SARP family transcriptional activator/tetratricopeptide (TPR) repeat protein
MIPGTTLRLLGGAVLERAGAPVTGRAAQRRRLALLALLALAPTRSLSRDRIICVLWPESDSEHARQLLAGAIYDLRRALGEDALVSRGDDVVLAALVETDVDAFEAAVRAGDHEAALACYAGPCLHGFHIADAAEFDHWSSGERDRLARLHAAALESVARRRAAEGDGVAAASFWRCLAGLDPYDSRIARELMLALDATGNRAGALQHARTHATLLREEFDAEPDAALIDLAERLRAGGLAAAAERAPPCAPPGMAAAPDALVEPVAPGAADLFVAPPVPTTQAMPFAASAAAVPVTIASSVRSWIGSSFAARAAGAGAPRHNRRATAVTGSTVLLAAVIALVTLSGAKPDGANPVGREPSIAVLPFRDLGGTSAHALMGDGLSEAIISTLSRVPGLRVAAPTSSFTFRDDIDVRAVGRHLGVAHVLEGTVRASGDRLTVTARLMDATTGYEIWTQPLHSPLQMRDIVGVQEDIVHAVVRALEIELAPGRRPGALVASTTDNLNAFNEYILGRHHFHRRTVDDIMTALRHFERAVQHDPTYALAHAGIAETYTLLGAYDYGVLPPRLAYPAARAAAERALQLQPDLAEAYTALASVHFNFDWDWDAAEVAFGRAQELNRGYAPAWHWHSLLHHVRGRTAAARAAILRGAELDPLSLVMSAALARHYYFDRDFPRAIEQYRRTLAIDSTFITARLGLGMSLLTTGRIEEAIAEFLQAERLLGASPPVLHSLLGYAFGVAGNRAEAYRHLAALEAGRVRGYFPAEYVALVHVGLGDNGSALASLELALENRSGGITYIGVEPLMDSLRNEPGFASLMQRAGLQAR